MPIPKPQKGEHQSDFMQKCMSDDKMIQEYEVEQRAAICRSAWEEHLAASKISFDFDGVLSTKKGFDLAQSLIDQGADVYIISARGSKDGLMPRANRLNIPDSKVYATGSNKAKVEKVKELNIDTHYDNNPDVIQELGDKGKLF